jgi:hypothetical protein
VVCGDESAVNGSEAVDPTMRSSAMPRPAEPFETPDEARSRYENAVRRNAEADAAGIDRPFGHGAMRIMAKRAGIALAAGD